MTPMMPKISVSPDATRNSSSPYCSEFRHWMRKVARSMKAQVQASGAGVKQPPWSRLCRSTGGGPLRGRAQRVGGGLSSHLAAAGWVGEDLDGDASHHVLAALDLAHVEVLHRGQADAQQLRRVVALHGIDVGLHLVGHSILVAEVVVARCVDAVGVVQRRLPR